MPKISVVTFLAVASVFQTPLSTPEKPKAATQAPAKEKVLSANWAISFPFVGCDSGKPILNAELPDVNAPTAICPGVQPPDVLPERDLAASTETQIQNYETGTVIALGISHDKIAIAADSRNVRLSYKRQPDGALTERKIEYDDCACKLTQLTPALLFAAAGQVSASTSSMPVGILYDAHNLARLAAQNYRADPNSQEEQLAGGLIEAIATRWAWDVDFRMHNGFAAGWEPLQTLEGIFVGLESDGETALIVAKLEYPKPRPGFRVPPVTFSIGKLSPPPTEFTWVEAFGIKEVAESYYSTRAVTEQTKAENKRISSEILKDPKLFSPEVPEHLVDLTIQHYEAITGEEGLLYVHGPIDLAVLERGKAIKWIHSKKCSDIGGHGH